MGERLAGRRVVVTDANEFMGPDIAVLFREEGAQVIADARDLTVPSASADLIREAGRVDILMVNLAATFSGGLVQFEDAELGGMLDRLVRPLHRLVRAVLPQMKARPAGKIVVVGSAVALRGVPRRAPYAAARGAQHAYVRTVGVEAAAFGVNVNATGQTSSRTRPTSPLVSGYRGVQEAHGRRAREAALDGTGSRAVPAVLGWTGERLLLWSSVPICGRLGDLRGLGSGPHIQ